jgi:hypothetical protein
VLTQEDVSSAADELLAVVAEFPFQKAEHRSAWLAALLTPIARWAFAGQSPLFFFDANQRGSGKGLLVKVIGLLVQGEEVDTVSPTRDEEEERKRITAKVLAGTKMVLFDNVNGPFGSSALDALLTTGIWADRILGRSEAPAIESKTIWYATGNNLAFRRDDTARRTCVIRLLTQEERPEERSGFRIPDLPDYVRQRRAELFGSALVLLCGWLRCGSAPERLPGWRGPWGGFNDWDRVVRGAIVYAGLEDPLAVKGTSHDSDSTNDVGRDVVSAIDALLAAMGAKEASAGELLAALETGCENLGDSGPAPEPYRSVRDTLASVAGGRAGRLPNAYQLGHLFRKLEDRPFRLGEQLGHLSRRLMHGHRLWRVERIEKNQPPPDVDDVERDAIQNEQTVQHDVFEVSR